MSKKTFLTLILFAVLLLLSKISNAQFSLVKSHQILGDDIGRVVKLIDFDNDNDLDAITKNGNMNGDTTVISFWTNNGNGFFQKEKPSLTLDGYGIINFELGNLDLDKDVDMLITTTGPSLLYLNDGNGNFKPGDHQIDNGGYTAKLADLDMDGDLDIFMLYLINEKTVRIWKNDGTGAFIDTGQKFGGGMMANCSLGDIDNNGTIDAITSGWYTNDDISTNCPNKIWLNDGSGVFTSSDESFFQEKHHIHGTALCDLDKDNDLDLILAVTHPKSSVIMLNNGYGHFTKGQILNYGWFDKTIPADIDNDGDTDIVAANGGHELLPNTIWLNDGKANFKDSGYRLGNSWTWDLAVGDIDNDGDQDIIYANFIIENDKLKSHPNTIWINDQFEMTWQYKTPGVTPELFAPGIISVEHKNSHALVFSPNGKTIIFSRYPDKTSYMISIENGKWSHPKETSFFGKEISFSPDGEKIYFYTGGDIYLVEKETSGWSEPEKVSSNINTSDQVEYYPCLVRSGAIYFSRNSNWKGARIMYSGLNRGQFEEAIDIGSKVNNGGASHAWVSPDETYMLFNSPREGSYTGNDIWVSFRNHDESWEEPINLGEEINSGADAILCPTVSPDGKFLFFTRLNFGEQSNTGLIYWVSTEIIDRLKEESSISR